MPKRDPFATWILGECRRAYHTGQDDALKSAVGICEMWGIPERKWMRDALYQAGRNMVIGEKRPKKTGRPKVGLNDAGTWWTVERLRDKGLTLEKALFAAEDLLDIPAATLKNAWIRYRKTAKSSR